MNKLTHSDGRGIAVAGDAEHGHLVVGENGPCRDGGHAAVHAIEAERAVHEVSRALGGAADAAHLHDALGLDAHFEHGIDDALGDGVVAAAGAQG